MQSKNLPAIALLASLIGLVAAEPVSAQYGGRPYGVRGPMAHPHGSAVRHRVHRHHARMLPPGIPYRDPSLDLRPRGRPDFLIHAYLPRFTELPMYNEPPAHFPQR